MKNYVQPGDTITVTAPAAIASGDGVLVGKLFGIAAIAAASGAEVEIKTTGVFNIGKNSAEAWAQGVDVYWDSAAKVMTTTATNNTLVAKAVLPADNPSGTGRVRLNG